MAAKKWRAVVTLGSHGSWVQNGFDTKVAALKAAEDKSLTREFKRKATGFRAEPE